jgi:hypothetical protein
MKDEWVVIIAKYGIDFAIQLAAMLQEDKEPTVEDFVNLKRLYGTQTADEILKQVVNTPV